MGRKKLKTSNPNPNSSPSLEESTLEGLCEAFRKMKLTSHWNSPIVDQNHMVQVPALKTLHTRASSTEIEVPCIVHRQKTTNDSASHQNSMLWYLLL